MVLQLPEALGTREDRSAVFSLIPVLVLVVILVF